MISQLPTIDIKLKDRAHEDTLNKYEQKVDVSKSFELLKDQLIFLL